jgi:hypothetical protein
VTVANRGKSDVCHSADFFYLKEQAIDLLGDGKTPRCFTCQVQHVASTRFNKMADSFGTMQKQDARCTYSDSSRRPKSAHDCEY